MTLLEWIGWYAATYGGGWIICALFFGLMCVLIKYAMHDHYDE